MGKEINTDMNKKNVSVSVIVATYRRNEALKISLISLAKQSYSDIEIIVVDDNNNTSWTDIVKDIIMDVSNEYNIRIIHLINKENYGSAMTRNIGVEHSRGGYLTFLDDDDLYLPDKVYNQVTHMINEKSDYSITDLFLYDEQNNLVEKRERNYLINHKPENLMKFHMKFHLTGTDTMMFKRDYFNKIGMFSLIDIGDEFYLMLKAIEGKGKLSYLNKCDIKAYVHRETKGLSSGDNKIFGENQLYEYKKQYFKMLEKKDVQYVKMRHYAVLAYAELRRKKYLRFADYSLKSLFSSPFESINLIVNRRY